MLQIYLGLCQSSQGFFGGRSVGLILVGAREDVELRDCKSMQQIVSPRYHEMQYTMLAVATARSVY
jgi:hypothetical protein